MGYTPLPPTVHIVSVSNTQTPSLMDYTVGVTLTTDPSAGRLDEEHEDTWFSLVLIFIHRPCSGSFGRKGGKQYIKVPLREDFVVSLLVGFG